MGTAPYTKVAVPMFLWILIFIKQFLWVWAIIVMPVPLATDSPEAVP